MHREVLLVDVAAVEVWRRRRDAEIGKTPQRPGDRSAESGASLPRTCLRIRRGVGAPANSKTVAHAGQSSPLAPVMLSGPGVGLLEPRS